MDTARFTAPPFSVLRFLRFLRACALAAALLACASDAWALRPFDGTDADVAAPGAFELELGPLGHLRDGAQKSWVAPAMVANFGLRDEQELVLQGNGEFARGRAPDGGQPASSLAEAGVFLKQVWRRGALQEAEGVSIATETGLLLPGIHADNGLGAQTALIVSDHVGGVLLHFNTALAINRAHHGEAFVGLIAEAPVQWRLRPVAEVFAAQGGGEARTVSRLVGLIWRQTDRLAFDAGLRYASAGGVHTEEVRAGLTWTFE